jgi:hypothetical protein
MKNLKIEANIVGFEMFAQPREHSRTKNDGTTSKRVIYGNMHISKTDSVVNAIKQTAALDDTEDITFGKESANFVSLSLDSITMQRLANCVDCNSFAKARVIAKDQVIRMVVQLREVGDVITDDEGNDLPEPARTNHAAILGKQTTIEMSAMRRRELLASIDDSVVNAEPIAVVKVVDNGKPSGKPVFKMPAQITGEKKATYNARVEREKESFAAKHNIEVADVVIA